MDPVLDSYVGPVPTYAEAHAKLDKEVRNAITDGTPYVVLPLEVAKRALDLFMQMAREEACKVPGPITGSKAA